MRALMAMACAVLVWLTAPAVAEKRVALVIGNSAYRHMPKLQNPGRDAGEVAAALTRLGFATTTILDGDRYTLNDGFKRFSQGAAGADLIFVYYSGHGTQLEGRNWLLPVDARLDNKDDINDADLLALDRVTTALRDKAAVRIVVLDACRDNPIANSLNLKIAEAQRFRNAPLTRGLARPMTAAGDLVVYSTQAGAVAADGSGETSPFTTSLLRHLETPDIDIRNMFFRVQTEVARIFKQTPEVSNSIVGEDFKLKVAALSPAGETGARPTVVPPSDPAERAWAVTQNSTSIAILEDFVRQFGATPYGSMARARIEELKKSQLAVVAPPTRLAAPAETAPKPAVGVFVPSSGVNPLSEEREHSLKPKDTFKECDACPEMVVVPAGSFTMGSPANEKDRQEDEGPQHTVTISKPFAVGKFSVTFAEWDACVADGGCNGHRPNDESWGRGKQPAINVSWGDAKAYLAWLSNKTRKTYRLLSEAEREYVTRAGTKTPFWWGSSLSRSRANYGGWYINRRPKGDWPARTLPVDSFQPNPFGLYQVHGNIYEWVEDCWHYDYTGAPSDGSAWISGDCKDRRVRGGSWAVKSSEFHRAAYRSSSKSDGRSDGTGFRVARTLSQ